VHVPQSGVNPPQPSLWRPHAFAGKLAHVFGTQTGVPASVTGGAPHWPGVAGSPPQVSGAVHAPHGITPPHPSACGPHAFGAICAHVLGVHGGRPHTPGTPPPPHVSGAAHAPHATDPPQPSARMPHPFAGQSCEVFGTQALAPPHLLGTPPPPHVVGAGQVPHWRTAPQPSPVGPHSTPCCAHVRGVQSGPASSFETNPPSRNGPPPSGAAGGGDDPPHATPRPVTAARRKT
jgi:hypothetical protein